MAELLTYMHAALWATMGKYNLNANLVRTIQHLYDKAISAVQMNGSTGDWFRTRVGIRQECPLSPNLINIILKGLPFFSGYKTEFFYFQNNPQNLDPSYKMDLDLWDCLGRVKLVL